MNVLRKTCKHKMTQKIECKWMSNAQMQKKTQWKLLKWTLLENTLKMNVDLKPSNSKRYIWGPFHFPIQNIYIDYNIE